MGAPDRIGSISGGADGGVTGQRCVSHVEEQTQMAIWSISASPMIMGKTRPLQFVGRVNRSVLLTRKLAARK